jgi:hypothetical protein
VWLVGIIRYPFLAFSYKADGSDFDEFTVVADAVINSGCNQVNHFIAS